MLSSLMVAKLGRAEEEEVQGKYITGRTKRHRNAPSIGFDEDAVSMHSIDCGMKWRC